jgi:hypothetical protein
MTKLKLFLNGFRREENGSIAIETVLIIPALFWAYLAMFAIFDSYRQYGMNQKAAYTIADMVSRETTPIDDQYLDGAQEMMRFLTNAPSVGEVSIRVSSIRYDADDDLYDLEWSEARGWKPSLSPAQVANWHTRLPVLTDNDRITLVETWVKYDPPFDTGLSDRVVQNFVFTKPRYAPQVLFDDGTGTL